MYARNFSPCRNEQRSGLHRAAHWVAPGWLTRLHVHPTNQPASQPADRRAIGNCWPPGRPSARQTPSPAIERDSENIKFTISALLEKQEAINRRAEGSGEPAWPTQQPAQPTNLPPNQPTFLPPPGIQAGWPAGQQASRPVSKKCATQQSGSWAKHGRAASLCLDCQSSRAHEHSILHSFFQSKNKLVQHVSARNLTEPAS